MTTTTDSSGSADRAGLSDEEKMAAVAELCTQAVNGFNDYVQRTAWGPTASSPAARSEVAARVQRGPDGYWDAINVREATVRCEVYLYVATEHIRALAALNRVGLYQLHIGPPARAVMEWSGKVMWLLDNRLTYDGGLPNGTRRRVARTLLDREHDARLAKDMAYKLNHPERTRLGDTWKQAKDLIRKPGLFYADEIVFGKGGTLKLCGEVLPGPSGFVREAGAIRGSQGASEMNYAYLSAVAHPTMYTFMDSVETLIDQSGTVHWQHASGTRSASTVVLNTLGSFHAAWALMANWLGHRRTEVDNLNAMHEELRTRLGLG